MYYSIFNIGNIVFYIMLGISVLLLLKKIIHHIIGLFPSKKFPDAKKDHKYAILIPARNESKVIEDLLISIKNQSYNSDLLETYIVVESKDDPTCEIAKKYKNTNIFVRQHLELKGKGQALNEVIVDILNSGKKYEAYFIFDADNVFSKDFIKEMNKCFDAGYQIALGYRNSKNWNDGWVASCSALTFSMINTLNNKGRTKLKNKVTLSGTGFYISGDIIEEMGGWKFCTLTEDYELSMFSTIKDIKTTYNEYAEFFDEQPSELKTSWNQRLRWCKGYTQVNKKYKKELVKSIFKEKSNRVGKIEYLMSIIPIVAFIGTAFSYAIFTLILGVVGSFMGEVLSWKVYMAFGISMFSIYLFFVLYTALMLFAERKRINISPKNSFIACLMGPFFLGFYIPLLIIAMFKKEVEWKPVVHNVKMNTKSLEIEGEVEENMIKNM